MEDELDRIIAYFSLSPEEKEKKLENIFSDSVEYFSRFKHIMENGTPEEKRKAAEKVMLLKKTIEEETQKVCEKTGMNVNELTEYANNPKNYSKEQWELISKSKAQLTKGAAGMAKAKEDSSSDSSKKTSSSIDKTGKGPGKKHKKPKGWISS